MLLAWPPRRRAGCVAWLRRRVSWPGRAPVDARAWYRGVRPPPYHDIIVIASGLDVSHDWLATGRGEREIGKRKDLCNSA